MKHLVLSLLLAFSTVAIPLSAHDEVTPAADQAITSTQGAPSVNFDIPEELAELFKDGQIDPLKFQEVFDNLPDDQKDKILAAAEQVMDEMAPALSGIKEALIQQVGQISFILQDLGQQIQSNKKIQIPNRQEVTEQVVALQQEVEGLKRMALSSAVLDDPQTLYNMILIIQELLNCVEGAITSKLTEVPAINEENITTRSIPLQEITPERLQVHIERNEKKLKALDKQANNIGLSFMNRAVMKFEQLNHDYRILPRLAKTAGAVFLATAVMALFDNKTFGTDEQTNSWFEWLCSKTKLSWWKQNVAGELPKTVMIQDESGGFVPSDTYVNEGNVTRLGSATNKLSNLGIIALAFTTQWTIEKLAKKWFGNDALSAWAWVQEKWDAFYGKLRGKKYTSKDSILQDPRYTFDDVVGHDHIKQELSILPAYFNDPEKMDRANKSPGKFWLLHGDSRVGKTMLAEALAGEIKAVLNAQGTNRPFTFIPLTAEDIIQNGFKDIMYYAEYLKPCLICIDEFEMTGAQRDRNSKLLAEILDSMSGALQNDAARNQIYFMFITNHIEHNDFALINRLDHIIEVKHPTLADRKEFLYKELHKQFIVVSPEFVDKIAQESEGKTIEELKRTITLAKQASYISHQPVGEADLSLAFDQQVNKILLAELPFNDQQIKQIAAYQAGKALTLQLLDTNLNVAKTTILGVKKTIHEQSLWSSSNKGRKERPKDWTKYGKVYTYHTEDTLDFQAHAELLNICKSKLAGHIAQELICGSQTANYRHSAKNKAYNLARTVIFNGVSEIYLPKKVKDNLKQQVHELITKCEQEVRTLLTENKELLQQLTDKLITQFIVTGDEINVLVNGKTEQTVGDEQESALSVEQDIVETELEQITA